MGGLQRGRQRGRRLVVLVIQGREGRVGQDRGMWFATWSIPTSCEVCEQEAFVIGHGLTRASVLAIAETVSQEPTPKADPATLPGGLRSMGSAALADGLVNAYRSAQEFVMRVGTTEATVRVWSGDPRLFAHLAFWSRDREQAQASEQGWSTFVDSGDDVVGVTAYAVPSEADADAVVAAARALVPGNDQAVDEAMANVVADLEPFESTRNLCEIGNGPWETFSGVIDDTRWGTTMMVADGVYFSECDSIWPATATHGTGGGTGTHLGPIGTDGVRFTGGGTNGSGGGRTVRIVTGDVPASAVTVHVECAGQTTEVKPGSTGPTPDRRWFATAFIVDGWNQGTRQEVTAVDASGATVATGSNG